MRHHFAEENIADASLGRLLRRVNATTGGFGVQPRRRQRTQQTPSARSRYPTPRRGIVSCARQREPRRSGAWRSADRDWPSQVRLPTVPHTHAMNNLKLQIGAISFSGVPFGPQSQERPS
jgi:hypothetical protein